MDDISLKRGVSAGWLTFAGKAGNAILLPDGKVVTCAHCLEAKEGEDPPQGPISICFEDGIEISAVLSAGGWRHSGVDIAVLTPAEEIPEAVAPVTSIELVEPAPKQSLLAAPWCADRKLYRDFKAETAGDGLPANSEGIVRLELKGAYATIVRGYSGGPVFRLIDGTRQFAGMIKGVDKCEPDQFEVIPAPLIRAALDAVMREEEAAAEPPVAGAMEPMVPVVDLDAEAPASGYLKIPYGQNRGGDGVPLSAEVAFTGPGALGVRGGERVIFGVTTALLKVDHPNHELEKNAALDRWSSTSLQSGVVTDFVGVNREKSVLSIESGDGETPFRGRVLHNEIDGGVLLGTLRRIRPGPSSLTAGIHLQAEALRVEGTDGETLRDKAREKAIRAIASKLGVKFGKVSMELPVPLGGVEVDDDG